MSTEPGGPSARRDPAADDPPSGELSMPADAGPDGLSDSACPAFDAGPLAMIYQLKAQLDALAQAFGSFSSASAADRRDMRRLLEGHTRDEAPRLRAIQTRLNVTLALVLAVGLFALAGPEGLRQIGDAVSRGGELGFDGLVTLAGAAIPLLYPIGRLIFLRLDNDRPPPAERKDEHHG